MTQKWEGIKIASDQIESNPIKPKEKNVKAEILGKKLTELKMTCKQILLNFISIISKYISVDFLFIKYSCFFQIFIQYIDQGKGEVYKREPQAVTK